MIVLLFVVVGCKSKTRNEVVSEQYPHATILQHVNNHYFLCDNGRIIYLHLENLFGYRIAITVPLVSAIHCEL